MAIRVEDRHWTILVLLQPTLDPKWHHQLIDMQAYVGMSVTFGGLVTFPREANSVLLNITISH